MNYKDVYRRQPISDKDWVIPFGRNKGQTIGALMENDPQYLEWCIAKEMIELDHVLLDEFEQMNPWMAG